MSIEEIVKQKASMEVEITKIVSQFQNTTGLVVADVNLTHADFSTAEEKNIQPVIKTKVELP